MNVTSKKLHCASVETNIVAMKQSYHVTDKDTNQMSKYSKYFTYAFVERINLEKA